MFTPPPLYFQNFERFFVKQRLTRVGNTLSLVLSGLMLSVLAACGGRGSSNPTPTRSTTPVTTALSFNLKGMAQVYSTNVAQKTATQDMAKSSSVLSQIQNLFKPRLPVFSDAFPTSKGSLPKGPTTQIMSTRSVPMAQESATGNSFNLIAVDAKGVGYPAYESTPRFASSSPSVRRYQPTPTCT